jgi:hypothetical protein
MKTLLQMPAAAAVAAVCASRVTIELAPGADQVRITRHAADVAACTAVDHVTMPPTPTPPYSNLDRQLRNQTVGLGGNALFVTEQRGGVVQAGIAYHGP